MSHRISIFADLFCFQAYGCRYEVLSLPDDPEKDNPWPVTQASGILSLNQWLIILYFSRNTKHQIKNTPLFSKNPLKKKSIFLMIIFCTASPTHKDWIQDENTGI